MAEMKNLCGKIPIELHEKIRQEMDQKQMTTSDFMQLVLNEHYTERGDTSMKTLAVQVLEPFFERVKAVLEYEHVKQKDFLFMAIERAVEEAEHRIKEEAEDSSEEEVEDATEEDEDDSAKEESQDFAEEETENPIEEETE